MIGEVINQRYKIEELIKEESQTSIYQALDLSLGKSCLVELMSFSPTDAENIPVYLQQLEEHKLHYHPQIPRLQDVFALEDELFPRICLIKQQIDATPLYQVLEQQGRYSEPETIELLLQLARIAEYLHGLTPPYIHQGIQPENVLIGKDKRLYLTGHTLLRIDGDGKKYPINPLPDYTAPEQMRGEPGPQTDLYLIGLTAIEMVSGRHYNHLPNPDLQASLNVSREFVQVLKRLISEDPAQRPASATALKNELINIKHSVQEQQKAIAAEAPLKKKQLIIPVIGGVMAVVAVFLLIVKFVNRPPAPAQATAPQSVTPRQTPPPQASAAATQADGLIVDIYRDFAYKPDMPPSVSISESPLETGPAPAETLTAEPAYEGEVSYSKLSLGNGADPIFVIALNKDKIYIDKNNDEDLSNDGPPDAGGSVVELSYQNAAAGETAAKSLPVRLLLAVDAKGLRVTSRSHYASKLKLGDSEHDVVALEASAPDGLLKNDGLWIDINKNGTFESIEHFADQADLPAGSQTIKLRLEYP